jgi:transcriptional regulator with GAF, ATPase, and Fis domain
VSPAAGDPPGTRAQRSEHLLAVGGRENAVTEAFVELSRSLIDGLDVIELLGRLTTDCARLLNVSSAGLLLADADGALHVMAATSERTRDLELFQVQGDQGPCRDCFHTGVPVLVDNLPDQSARWPRFAAAAAIVGFRSVHAVPMRLRDATLGALGLFGTQVGAIPEQDLRLAQALADVASIAIITDKVASDRETVAQQLQYALTSRIVIEQAKGLVAQLGDLDMEQAFGVLRRYARDHNRRLTDVAEAIVNRSLAAQLLLDHFHARGGPGSGRTSA